MGDFAALLEPSLSYRIDRDGTLRAEGSGTIVGVLLTLPLWLALAWALVAAGSKVRITAVLLAIAILPFAIAALLLKVRLTIDPSRVRYERRGLRWRSAQAPRSALTHVALVRRSFQAESRFTVYDAELRFDDHRLPSRIKVFESLDCSKAETVAEFLSSHLKCPLREDGLR